MKKFSVYDFGTNYGQGNQSEVTMYPVDAIEAPTVEDALKIARLRHKAPIMGPFNQEEWDHFRGPKPGPTLPRKAKSNHPYKMPQRVFQSQ